MPSKGTRRAVLRAAALLLAAGCARQPRPRGPRPSSSPPRPTPANTSGDRFPIIVRGATPEQLASFAAFAPGLQPLPSAGATANPGARWQIGPSSPFQTARRPFAPLEPALRQVNFNPAVLLPGTYAAFAAARGSTGPVTTQASHYGLPTALNPWAVQYDASVFTAVGLPAPAPDWSIHDFNVACATIQAAIATGRLPHLQSVLDPLVHTRPEQGLLAVAPELWGAFVVGYGGTVVADGRFDLSNKGAVAGLTALTELAIRYGPPMAKPATGQSAMAFQSAVNGLGFFVDGYASGLALAAWAPIARLRGGWAWARFPRLPVTPVIPASVTGVTVAPAPQTRKTTIIPTIDPASTPLQALVAVAQYVLWTFSEARTAPSPTADPPVLAAADVQDRFWRAPRDAAQGYSTIGDWRHFDVLQAGWPAFTGFGAGWSSPVTPAVVQAVQEGSDISGLLAAWHGAPATPAPARPSAGAPA